VADVVRDDALFRRLMAQSVFAAAAVFSDCRGGTRAGRHVLANAGCYFATKKERREKRLFSDVLFSK
jgi:hypothetical protein